MVAEADTKSSSPPTDRVIDIMEMLAAAPERTYTLAQICRAQGVSRATGHAIMRTLGDRGWAQRHEPASYSLGTQAVLTFGRTPSPRLLLNELMTKLADELGMPIALAQRQGGFMVIDSSYVPEGVPARVAEGLALPLVAPFGREFIAWADDSARRQWVSVLSPALRQSIRIDDVLTSIRRRGYAIDRLSRPLVRVHAALRALGDEVVIDEISTSLAAVYADLTPVDITDAELRESEETSIATISAPLRGPESPVTLSLAAQPFVKMSAGQITALGDRLVRAAGEAQQVLAGTSSTD